MKGYRCFLFFLLGMMILSSCENQSANTALFEEYFQPMPLIHLPVDYPEGEQWEAIKTTYKSGEYHTCRKQIKALYEPNDSLQAILKILDANCILASDGSTTEAIKVLQSIYKEPYPFHGIANWYLGLAYIKNDQLDDARRVIWEIFRKEGNYQQKAARNLIDELLININDMNQPSK
ncbi:MAG: hypothetical protein AAF598_19700 [Bacteroidota bacterium]